LGADVNGRADALGVEGVHLAAQQVELAGQGWVAGRMVRVVIEMPVMALGEAGYAVDVGRFGHRGETFGIELGPDVADVRRGVKVQVNLTESIAILAIESSLLLGFEPGQITLH